jgi:hypothetical protein
MDGVGDEHVPSAEGVPVCDDQAATSDVTTGPFTFMIYGVRQQDQDRPRPWLRRWNDQVL